MFILRTLLATLLLTMFASAQEHVCFPIDDGGVVYTDVHGKGERGVVLAHGGRFNKVAFVPADVGTSGAFLMLFPARDAKACAKPTFPFPNRSRAGVN